MERYKDVIIYVLFTALCVMVMVMVNECAIEARKYERMENVVDSLQHVVQMERGLLNEEV